MARNNDENLETAETSQSDESRGSDDETAPGRDPNKPMSDMQRTYLDPLAESQNEKVRDDMTEAEAANTIDRLQENAVHLH